MLKKLTITKSKPKHIKDRRATGDLCTKPCFLRCDNDPALNQTQFYFLSNWA